MSIFHLMTHQEDREAAAHERSIAKVYEQRAQMGLGDDSEILAQAQVHHDRALYFSPTQGTA